MKKLLLSLSIVFACGVSQAQNLASQNFDVFPTTWTQTNQSVPVGTTMWNQGAGGTTFPGHLGGDTSYTSANYNSTTGANPISNWLITPSINVQNGDIVSFYTRTITASAFPDGLELRMSTNGAFTTNPSLGNADLGDFTTLLVDVNTILDVGGYPTTWTQFTATISGLSAATDCKFAFRYYVSTSGGPLGDNSNYIGVDTFSVDRPLATENFVANNFAVYPNPANADVTISAKNNSSINSVEITDINGRVIKTVNVNAISSNINISELNTGVYFLKITSDAGVGSTKLVKN